jgi:uncharacterized protein (TIGR02145 family)
MKTKQSHLIFTLVVSVVLLIASSCKKDDENNINPVNTFTDTRDGNVYKTVTIGKQIWMAENLKYLPDIVGPAWSATTIPYYYVYDYNGTNVVDAKETTNYNTYGVLYNWEAAREACPTGWKLPSSTDWAELTDFLGGISVAGGKLKEKGTTHWKSPNTGATNETGFTALPGGFRGHGLIPTFNNIGEDGIWWSSTGDHPAYAWHLHMRHNNSDVIADNLTKEFPISVRCLRE